MTGSIVRRLAALRGIQAAWTDWRGREHALDTETMAALLRAMGSDTGSTEALRREITRLEEADWREVLPPVVVLRADGEPALTFTVLRPLLQEIRATLRDEHDAVVAAWSVCPDALEGTGERVLGDLAFSRRLLPLPALAPGVYRLALATGEGRPLDETRLVVTPGRCHAPGGRRWGLAVQLYGLRSPRNWGIGDFTDLARLAGPAAALGADFIGVSPLHALFPTDPGACSPYSPCHRQFLNVMFVDPEAVPEYHECEEAVRRVARPGFQARLAALRASEQVDYAGVAAAKDEVLRLAWERFRSRGRPERRRAWEAFLANSGRPLRELAEYYAIRRHFTRAGRPGGWPAWPAGFEHSRTPASRSLARALAPEADYQCWLQWLAAGQLGEARAAMHGAGMSIGLYEDLAVGADPGGAETWSGPGLYARGVSIGAPPDPLASGGQDWGLPPVSPPALRARGMEPLRRLLAAIMGRADALRLDHVMALARLWWVPHGRSPEQGGYVAYPLEALAGIVTLESRRARCIVIGEDLGTVPPDLRAALAAWGLLSYRVLPFERDREGAFLPPAAYPEAALVTTGTHDMPTLAGWWRGRDIDIETTVHDRADEAPALREERARDRGRLLTALAEAGRVAGEGLPGAPAVDTLVEAVQGYLAATPSVMLALRPEDWLGLDWPANVPGTVTEYPNWRRRLPEDLTTLLASLRIRRLAAGINALRAGEAGGGPGDGLTA